MTVAEADRVLLLAPRDDLPALAERFAQRQRLQVPDVLDPGFRDAVAERVSSWPQWALVTIVNGQHRNFDAAQMEGIDLEARARFDEMVSVGARSGFQYLYERYPLHDPHVEGRVVDDVLQDVCRLLRSEDFLELGRAVTGCPEISCADRQLTRYRRGHYLTSHTDHADGKHRVAAYVIGLTPQWSPDFGGQLQFLGEHDDIDEVMMPRYNAMNIFRVPAPHLVSAVAPFVTAARYSITGWFRSG